MKQKEQIIFFGTPEFAVPILQSLVNQFNVVGVVTQPDKPVGRKKILTPPPVKMLAEQLGIPVLQPEKISPKHIEGQAFIEKITKLNADCFVVAAYGKILSETVLQIPTFGCINVHPSMLPEFRGATPIQSALLHGKATTGTTIMKMDASMDTGDILAQESLHIQPNWRYPELDAALSRLSAKLLVESLIAYFNDLLTPTPQSSVGISYCTIIQRQDGEVSQNDHAIDVYNKFRAYTPWPGIFIIQNEKRIKLIDIIYNEAKKEIEIQVIQEEGKKPQHYIQWSKQHGQQITFQ